MSVSEYFPWASGKIHNYMEMTRFVFSYIVNYLRFQVPNPQSTPLIEYQSLISNLVITGWQCKECVYKSTFGLSFVGTILKCPLSKVSLYNGIDF